MATIWFDLQARHKSLAAKFLRPWGWVKRDLPRHLNFKKSHARFQQRNLTAPPPQLSSGLHLATMATKPIADQMKH